MIIETFETDGTIPSKKSSHVSGVLYIAKPAALGKNVMSVDGSYVWMDNMYVLIATDVELLLKKHQR